METNGIEGGNDEGIKKQKKDKSGKFKGASSYKCQFCDKSFPRLGYLKKHEQVSELNFPTIISRVDMNALLTVIVKLLEFFPLLSRRCCFMMKNYHHRRLHVRGRNPQQ